jgi:IMP dehydrogenase
LAKLGGLGVIHRGNTPEEQKEELRRVKFNLSGKIGKPITVSVTETLEEVRRRREERGFAFYTFPVLDENGRLVGILTENDFDFSDDWSRKVGDVMTKDGLVTAGPRTSLDQAYGLMRKNKKKVLPLVDREMRVKGMYLWGDVKRIKSGMSDMHNVDAEGRLIAGIAVGMLGDAYDRVAMMHEYADVVVIDTAHADTKDCIETVRRLKRDYDIDVVVGNVSQGHSAVRLVKAGADGIKVGQGPGSICTTRIVAGVGRAQVSAIWSVVHAIEKMGRKVPVCADGGIVNPGDIPIAIGAGAMSVMLGKVFAGTDEAPGEVDRRGPVARKMYRGMGSLSALTAMKSSRERYRDVGKDGFVPEGVESFVPYAGELWTVIHQFVGGLRKGMGYVGARNIEHLRKKADFDLASAAGIRENHPHDVEVRESRRDA